MPATEQPWRNLTRLHLIFGLSGLTMFAATLWMLVADHRREWRQYQRDFVRVSNAAADWRVSELQTAQFKATTEQLQRELDAARSLLPNESAVRGFAAEVIQYRRFCAGEIPQEQWLAPPDYESIQEYDNTDILPRFVALRDFFARTDDARRRRDARNQFIRGGLIFQGLNGYLRQARTQEGFVADEKKFTSADFSVAASNVDLAIRDAAPPERLFELQQAADALRRKVAELDQRLQDASTHRKNLEALFARIVEPETVAQKALDDHQADFKQRVKASEQRAWNFGKTLLELPILDGFSPALRIDQIWLPNLTIDLNFRRVARFDRCITCHQASDVTAPGSPTEPAYEQEHFVELTLHTPAEAPQVEVDAANELSVLELIYGMTIAPRGVLDPNAVTVSVVRPESLAAMAGVRAGDVLYKVNDGRVLSKQLALDYLCSSPTWGKPVRLTVRRGVPHPFSSHPRLDLFLGSTSPHPQGEFGCTICHEGQGSATAFEWASHTPNTPLQRTLWRRERGWFDNHHWIFPMYPARFAESGCVKCHHEITELEPSDRYPEPPAAKLVRGFHLIRRHGCFGCHEINGYSAPDRRIGPDLRLEPQVAAAAEAFLQDPAITPQEREWGRQLVRAPDNDEVRRRLEEIISADAAIAARGREKHRLQRDTHALAELFKDAPMPGEYRKVGPSLRRVAAKLDLRFLYDWVANPTHFRPDTPMPRFFGLYEHLSQDDRRRTAELESAEIQAIAAYLLAKSQPFEYRDRPAGVTESPSAQRGKLLFETRCLACHKHQDFPEAKGDFGPDLSRLGSKLLGEAVGNQSHENDKGAAWLYTWLRNPADYHSRTFMPEMKLDPAPEPDGKVSDPAADIATYLLSSQGWAPVKSTAELEREKASPEFAASVDALALDYLVTVYTRRQAEEYLRDGIPASAANTLRGAEVELIGEGMTLDKKLRYLGRRTIAKYGCYGCHDIPGFETAKPIGTTLADWGRKDTTLLAFEHISEYLAETLGHRNDGAGHLEPSELDPDVGFFVQAIQSRHREGFLWQKLRQPRSYDYHKTENKGFHERLRMPQFSFTQDEIEAVMTFILGLVSDPPMDRYIFRPDPQRGAELAGTRVLQRFNCSGCHVLKMERWEFFYRPDEIAALEPAPDYEFLAPHFSPEEVRQSLATDRRGLGKAVVFGRADRDDRGRIQFYDEEFTPLSEDDIATGEGTPYYQVELWHPALIHGQPREVGDKSPLIAKDMLARHDPAWGGDLPDLVYARVLEEERQFNSAANPAEVWGWLPPPLVGEGRKVRPEWLHEFLLDPYAIRPATILRMPKFNMSPAEARRIADYFAAVDRAEYPYDAEPRRNLDYLARMEASHANRYGDALKIMTNSNYCVKCHALGDYVVTGKPTAFGTDKASAPNLDRVYTRLRSDFTRRWVANPKRLLPYTGMPVNIPADNPVSQDLYRGTSIEQLDAVVDLLMNYDRFAKEKTSIKPLVQAASAEPPQAATKSQEGGGPGGG